MHYVKSLCVFRCTLHVSARKSGVIVRLRETFVMARAQVNVNWHNAMRQPCGSICQKLSLALEFQIDCNMLGW